MEQKRTISFYLTEWDIANVLLVPHMRAFQKLFRMLLH